MSQTVTMYGRNELIKIVRNAVRSALTGLGGERGQIIRQARRIARAKANGEEKPTMGRKPRVDISDATRNEIIALYKGGGVTQNQVAKKYNIARSTVVRTLKNTAGAKPAKRAKVTDETRSVIVNGRKAGFTYKDLAKKTGVSEVTVFGVLHKAGLTKALANGAAR